jgi:DNA-binding NtrC family response regulator
MTYNANILVVDDNPQIRSLFEEVLKREGFNVEIASNGNEGLRVFQTSNIDLVITDIVMPEKDGIELIMEIKKDNTNIPIIAISGGGIGPSATYLTMAKALGAYTTFEKPASLKEIVNTVKQAINQK